MILSQYEQILPGAADRILKMAENEQHYSQTQESKIIKINLYVKVMGVCFSFILMSALIITGGALIYKDKDVQGLSILIASGSFFGYQWFIQRKKQDQD